jgi:hypothetical protein
VTCEERGRGVGRGPVCQLSPPSKTKVESAKQMNWAETHGSISSSWRHHLLLISFIEINFHPILMVFHIIIGVAVGRRIHRTRGESG